MMAGVRDFTELRIWQNARELSRRIFLISQREQFRSDRRLVWQINDSSASVMANIAEGFGRGTQGEFVLFLGYAIGSIDETRSHLFVALDREYLSAEEHGVLSELGSGLRRQTVAFMKSMDKSNSGVKNSSKRAGRTNEVREDSSPWFHNVCARSSFPDEPDQPSTQY